MAHDPGLKSTFSVGSTILAFDVFVAHTRPVKKASMRVLTKPDIDGADVVDDGQQSAKATATATRFFEDQADFDGFVESLRTVLLAGQSGTLTCPAFTVETVLLRDFEISSPRGVCYGGDHMLAADVRLFFEAI